MHRRVYPSLSRPLALSVLLTLWVPIAMAQANVQGQWNTLPYLMPINPVHAALLSNGKVLVVAGSGNCPPSQSGCPSGPPYGPANNSGALLWDPVAGSITQFSLSWDMFCNGMVLLQDGRALIDSGTIQYDPFHGQPKVAVFDPATNLFTDIQNMAHGRWYPTVLTLGDGRVMAFSGLNETGGTNTAVEFYTAGTGWSQEYPANLDARPLPTDASFAERPGLLLGSANGVKAVRSVYNDLEHARCNYDLQREPHLRYIRVAPFNARQQLRSKRNHHGRPQPGYQYDRDY